MSWFYSQLQHLVQTYLLRPWWVGLSRHLCFWSVNDCSLDQSRSVQGRPETMVINKLKRVGIDKLINNMAFSCSYTFINKNNKNNNSNLK